MSLYHCYYDSLRKPHSEKLYPQFLHPFRQCFYLQSTGFTNRVAYRFFPFPFPTVFLRPRTISYLASISNYYKSILYYYLALRVKYIGWKMVLYESNDYHNFPTLWGRTNPLHIRVSYKVKKKKKISRRTYSTVDRPLRTFEFRVASTKTRRETVPIVNRSSISRRGQS